MIKINESISEEQRSKMIKDPIERKVFNAVSDAMSEYGDNLSGNRSQDRKYVKKYNDYVEKGNVKDLKDVAAFMFDLTGFSCYLWR